VRSRNGYYANASVKKWCWPAPRNRH